ncbi:fumarylacetoacetate hydrolase family protein [Salinarchaeum laminariae]|uniref:fumarylacetoacetate hydrolase family protein n=1 Tax=Salinarchaeum laminariae TaxID=869888 RepID=UPI0020BE4C9D|nr:fumarylacetoacetate hydrolase family protein [Salinarchaeum laminariae]
MHHVRFRDPAGAVRKGTWTDDGVAFAGREYDLEEVDVLAPCEPSKIVCIGRNYVAHADERDEDVPDRPLLFLKPPNTVASHGDTVELPAGKETLEYEAELGVVIGEQCRDVSEADAESVIAGYTCGVDLSNRDDQSREQNWVRGKAFDGAAPLGPVLATPDELPGDARIRLWQNGELRQDATLDQLVFPIPELIAEITSYLTLEPGDVVLTGTPEGVGPLADGDEIAVEVEGVGRLEHDVTIPE